MVDNKILILFCFYAQYNIGSIIMPSRLMKIQGPMPSRLMKIQVPIPSRLMKRMVPTPSRLMKIQVPMPSPSEMIILMLSELIRIPLMIMAWTVMPIPS